MLTTLENLENSGILLILENSGKFEIYSGNCRKSDGMFLGHRFVCILILSNSSIVWLCDTVTGVGGAGHFAP